MIVFLSSIFLKTLPLESRLDCITMNRSSRVLHDGVSVWAKVFGIALKRLELTDDCGTGVIGAARLLGVEVPERSPSIGLVVLLRRPSAGGVIRSGLFSILICLRSGSGSGLMLIRLSFE